VSFEQTPEAAAFLKRALALVKAEPYKVTLRHLFYQLLDTDLGGKKATYGRFKANIAYARKHGLCGWKPDTVVDDTRHVVYRGWAPLDAAGALAGLIRDPRVEISHFARQRCYVELWMESEGSVRQFEYIAPGFTLRPFKGSFTIEPRWRAAKDIEQAAAYFGKPVVILYFGDCDKKGQQIPENAVKSIRKWCRVPFEFIPSGLTVEQAHALHLTASPEKPAEYQWEALTTAQAGRIVRRAIDRMCDRGAIREARAETDALKAKIAAKLREVEA
jgi:hypothetical protein